MFPVPIIPIAFQTRSNAVAPNSLHKNALFRLGELPGLNSVQVHAARKMAGGKRDFVIAGTLVMVDELCLFLPKNVVYFQNHFAGRRNRV